MAKYLKEFADHNEYAREIPTAPTPNVSYCVQEGEVHFVKEGGK